MMSVMTKSGFVHVLPLVIVAVVGVGVLTASAIQTEKIQKEAVGRVLSSSDDNEVDKSGSSSGSSSSDSGSNGEVEKREPNSHNSSGAGSSDEVKIESRTEEGRTKIKTSPEKTKIEIRNKEGRFETKIEEGREETKIRTGGLRIEVKREGNRVVTKIKNENDEEVELEDSEVDELLKEIEDELDGVKLATDSAQPGFVQNGRRVRTNFPLSVNAQTGELFVTTPAGEKVVTVLPNVAIENMIAAGVMTRIIDETPPPSEGTSEADLASGVELTTFESQPVYVINGVSSQNFLGLVPLDIKVKTIVSATSGQLLDTQQGIFGRVLDILSF